MPTMPASLSPEAVKALIHEAFAGNAYPGDWCLRGSDEGEEPYLLEEEFKGKADWRTLDAAFIDRAPDGYGSALNFFSDEAFRFYLPAYLVADIDGKLARHQPSFQLVHGLDDASRAVKINPRRYGERTWWDYKRSQFAMFTREEVRAIVAYLELVAARDEFDRPRIEQALAAYWRPRLEGKPV